MINVTDDAEFARHMVALDKVLDLHLGARPDADALDAEYVMMPLWLPSAGLGAMNAQAERKKLAKVQGLARELGKVWCSLHPDIRDQMVLQSETLHEVKTDAGALSSPRPISLNRIMVLGAIIDLTEPLANEVIDDAPPAGRRNLISVGIVRHLRAVWAERKGTPAPKSMSEAGPFADFMIDAFEAIGIDANPRAAVDSWQEFRTKYSHDE